MTGFTITELESESGYREICVVGELDLSVARQLQEALDRSDSELTVVNLEDCEFIDSTGIAVIVRAYRERASSGGRVVLHSPCDQVLRVLTVTGLTENGLVFGSRDEAVSSSA